MRQHIRRSEQGYRVGEDHHNARHADAVVRYARDLHEFDGLGPRAIVARIALVLGVTVSLGAVKHWVGYTSRNVTPREREERVPTHRTVR